MSIEAEELLGLSSDNRQDQQRCKPVMLCLAAIFNGAVILTIIYTLTLFRPHSGMEGMFAVFGPILVASALIAFGFLSNLIGVIRGEPLNLLSGISLAFSIVMGIITAIFFLSTI